MNPLPIPSIPVTEKRSQRSTMVLMIDSRGRALWNSLEPFSPDEPTLIIDQVPADCRRQVLENLSRCIVSGEITEYLTLGNTPRVDPGASENWHVVLYPANDRLPGVAAVAVCRVLPTNHGEITQEDKDLIRLLCDDYTLKEIATRMFLSESAIDTRIKHLKGKLGVKNIGGLVASALMQSVI